MEEKTGLRILIFYIKHHKILWVASEKYFATHLVCNEIHLFINSHLISENTHKRVCKKKKKKTILC